MIYFIYDGECDHSSLGNDIHADYWVNEHPDEVANVNIYNENDETIGKVSFYHLTWGGCYGYGVFYAVGVFVPTEEFAVLSEAEQLQYLNNTFLHGDNDVFVTDGGTHYFDSEFPNGVELASKPFTYADF